MGDLERLDAAAFGRVVAAFRDGLAAHRDAINRLNVYPVPDGDTGTNMALTLESVASEIDALDAPAREAMASVAKAVSHGSLMGARGNSGVILSQLLRGVSEELAASDGAAGPGDLARALTTADRLARDAVMRPVEGTILTVARAAAEGAAGAARGGEKLCEVVRSARDAAADALARTPEMLPVLAEAGVVDAGGSGLLLLLDAFVAVVTGAPMPAAPAAEGASPAALEARLMATAAGEGGEESNLAGLRYEVMYLLHAPDETIPAFKEVWAGVGDSIVVVGGDGLWNCHIHTDDIGAAIEACLDAGKPSNIRVTDLLEQVEEERWVREGASEPDDGDGALPAGPVPRTAVIAVATGDGIKRIFRSLGASGLIAGGQSMNPSTRDILDVVEASRSDEVVILPNNKNIRAVAEAVVELSHKAVRVVPTTSVVEGFAALLAYDPDGTVDENAEAMAASAERVVAGEVTQAVRATECAAGPIAVGDWLGLSREGIDVVAPTLEDAACGLLERLVGEGHELVTLIEGEGSSAAVTRRMRTWLDEHRDGVDVEVHAGGQPLYPYLISIE